MQQGLSTTSPAALSATGGPIWVAALTQLSPTSPAHPAIRTAGRLPVTDSIRVLIRR